MTRPNFGRLTSWLIAAWFATSLSAAALGLIKTEPGRPPFPLLVAVVVPLSAFGIWYAASRSFREFVLALSPRALTLVQSWRTAGFVFLVLARYRILPASFALPAGWGDIAIGVTAVFVASRLAVPKHRRVFILWQMLGMLDLVMAVTLGATAALVNPNGIPTSPMTVLPMSLIPTFAVPLLLLLHIICIAQALRWAKERSKNLGNRFDSVAV
jgi:hypothetical protein